MKIHDKIIATLNMTLDRSESRVKINEKLSEKFTIRTGFNTRDSLSPILFHVALEKIGLNRIMTGNRSVGAPN